MHVPVTTTRHGRPLNSRVVVDKHTVVPLYTTITVPIRHNIHIDDRQALLFEPTTSNKMSIFAAVADCHLQQVIVRNDTAIPLVIPGNHCIGHLVSIDPGCQGYLVENNDAIELATQKPMMPTEERRLAIPTDHDDERDTVKHPSAVTLYKLPAAQPAPYSHLSPSIRTSSTTKASSTSPKTNGRASNYDQIGTPMSPRTAVSTR